MYSACSDPLDISIPAFSVLHIIQQYIKLKYSLYGVPTTPVSTTAFSYLRLSLPRDPHCSMFECSATKRIYSQSNFFFLPFFSVDIFTCPGSTYLALVHTAKRSFPLVLFQLLPSHFFIETADNFSVRLTLICSKLTTIGDDMSYILSYS